MRGEYMCYPPLIIDNLYALVYGLVFSIIIISLLKVNKISLYKILAIIPFCITIFDLFENAGIVIMLLSLPTKLDFIYNVSSIANIANWIFVLIPV